MVTWLIASFEMHFRIIGGLTVRFAASESSGDHALLLSPWPESLLAFDTAVPAANARFLHERLPHNKLDVIDAGHFTWEDAAAEYATLVTSWWRDAARGARK